MKAILHKQITKILSILVLTAFSLVLFDGRGLAAGVSVKSIEIDNKIAKVGDSVQVSIQLETDENISKASIHYVYKPNTNDLIATNMDVDNAGKRISTNIPITDKTKHGQWIVASVFVYTDSTRYEFTNKDYSPFSDSVDLSGGTFQVDRSTEIPHLENIQVDKHEVNFRGNATFIGSAVSSNGNTNLPITVILRSPSNDIWRVDLSTINVPDYNTRSGSFYVNSYTELGLWKVDSLIIKDPFIGTEIKIGNREFYQDEAARDFSYLNFEVVHKIGWVQENGRWYYYDEATGLKHTGFLYDYSTTKSWYFDENGEMVTGWLILNPNDRWYFGPDGSSLLGWNTVDGNKYYFLWGGRAANTWTKIDNGFYFFNQQGILQTGKVTVTGFNYTLQPDGRFLGPGWFVYQGRWHYLLSGGTEAIGFHTINGSTYYFDQYGDMAFGTILDINGKRYSFEQSGKMITGWHFEYGNWYYYKPDGAAAVGWAKVGTKWYFFDEDYTMYTGILYWNDELYFLNDNGSMVTGWVKFDRDWYYFLPDGKMAWGWQKIGDKWYYLDDEEGSMVTGWKQINSKWYLFDGTGAMKSSAWVQSGGKSYYLKASGAMAANEWVKISTKWYYFNTSGLYVTGWKQINSKWYLFDGTGAMKSSAWVQSGGKSYYLKDSGAMAANEWVKISTKWYYFNASGLYVTGLQTINGKQYFFYSNGVWKQ